MNGMDGYNAAYSASLGDYVGERFGIVIAR